MNKLLIFLSAITLVSCQCNVERAKPFLKRSVHEFNVDLASRVGEDRDYHFVVSGLSPWALLATISLGATDNTYTELKNALRLHPHPCFNGKFFEIVKELTEPKDGITIERSSSLFVDDRFSVKDVFKRRVERSNITQIKEFLFENAEEVCSTINEYVNTATRGSIDEIVTPSDLEGVYLVLIDALFFKGSWKYEFSAADTEASAFYNQNGDQIGDAELMYGAFDANVIDFKQIESKVLELPYDNRYVMLVILPEPNVSVAKVLHNLKRFSMSSFFLQFKEPAFTTIQLPKFKISTDLNNMKELLIDMGLKDMFDSSAASFTDLCDHELFVSNVIQKANIEVSEQGTEASAATAAMFLPRASMYEQEFLANRPFIFMIVDKETEIALFTGAYSKPSTSF